MDSGRGRRRPSEARELASLTGFVPVRVEQGETRRDGLPEGTPATERSEGVGVPDARQLEPDRRVASTNRRA